MFLFVLIIKVHECCLLLDRLTFWPADVFFVLDFWISRDLISIICVFIWNSFLIENFVFKTFDEKGQRISRERWQIFHKPFRLWEEIGEYNFNLDFLSFFPGTERGWHNITGFSTSMGNYTTCFCVCLFVNSNQFHLLQCNLNFGARFALFVLFAFYS